MPSDHNRDALYTGQINLWVEDSLTRSYLSELWNDPAVKFLIAGGYEGVEAINSDAKDFEYSNVFGLVDADFRQTNRAEWMTDAKTFRTFVLPVHEIENYLLDADALRSSRFCRRELTIDDLNKRMQDKASTLCWWAACRETIAVLKRRFRQNFVTDPKQNVTDEVAARQHICDSEWFKKLATECGRSNEADVHKLLADYYHSASNWIRDGSWKQKFAGKEILRDVAGWMYDQPKINVAKMNHSDLAKEIAKWQVGNDKIPVDLAELLTALKKRIQRQGQK